MIGISPMIGSKFILEQFLYLQAHRLVRWMNVSLDETMVLGTYLSYLSTSKHLGSEKETSKIYMVGS